MANFGDILREWINTVWKPDDEKALKIIDEEWEKATEELVYSTPEGQIRFALFNRKKLLKKLSFRLIAIKSTEFISKILDKKSNESPFCEIIVFGFPFPMYGKEYDHQEQLASCGKDFTKVVLLYANKIESNPNAAKDFITYWFETHVLPSFEISVKSRKRDYLHTIKHSKLFFGSDIIEALINLGVSVNDEDWKTIFEEICNNHGVKLNKFNFSNVDSRYYHCSFEISL